MDEITPLPFPLLNTTGISNIYEYHLKYDDSDEIYEKTSHRSYYFTIPMRHLRPSPCTFNDVQDSRAGEAYRDVLVMLFHMMFNMFFGQVPHSKNLLHGEGKRYNVFMEYLLPPGVDPDDFTLIDAIGIRFHLHIYDDDLDILYALKKIIEQNGGHACEEASVNENNDVEGEQRPKKKRKTQGMQKRKKIEPYDSYMKLTSMWNWFTIANNASASFRHVDERKWVDFTLDQESWAPAPEHPFHPNNYFSWERSTLPGMNPLQAVESVNFGIPSAVFYVGEQMRNSLAILGVTLPLTPLWFEQDEDSVINTLSSLRSRDFMEHRLKYDAGYIKRNDLKEIKIVQDLRLRKLKEKEDPEILADEVLKFRKRSIKYIAAAWRQGAFVSTPIQMLATKAHELKTWTTGRLRLLDNNMSSFGNFIARMLMDFEKILRISTTHAILLRTFINALDAYRNDLDLHNNVVLLGEGATGKSHMLNCIQDMLLNGTVKTVTHLTDKALAVDTDNNDHITCFHEMPPQLLGSEKSGAETGSHLIKDMMTSCSVETQTINVDSDTGRRRKIRTVAEWIGVFIMATNERFDKIPQALATRMIAIVVNDVKRDKFSVNDVTCPISGVTGGDYSSAKEKAVFEDIIRKMQNVLVMVEKMIYTNILEDVCMDVFNTMQINMTQYMIDHHIMYSGGNIRDIKYLKHFARTVTLMHAVVKFINDPQSPGFKYDNFGSESSFECLLKIQPYLFCTEEIALFTLSINADQLIKINHFKVVELLLHSAWTFFARDGSGELIDTEGYYRTLARFKDYNSIYNLLEHNQADFKESISRQNIIVAFRELQTYSFEHQPIIRYDESTQVVYINRDYVKKHFQFNEDFGRYVCNFDINSIIIDVFNKAYVNKYTKEQKNMIVGTTYHKDAPFLFNTVHKKPNPERTLNRYMAISSDDDDQIEEVEENEFYERVNDQVRYKIDFENFSYMTYLEKCGLNPSDYNLMDIVYDHHSHDAKITHKSYPTTHAKWYEKFTKIKLK